MAERQDPPPTATATATAAAHDRADKPDRGDRTDKPRRGPWPDTKPTDPRDGRLSAIKAALALHLPDYGYDDARDVVVVAHYWLTGEVLDYPARAVAEALAQNNGGGG